MADLSQQVQLQQALNDALRERNALINEQNAAMGDQSQLANELRQSMGDPSVNQRVNSMTDALRRNNEQMREGSDLTKELSDALDEAADSAEEAASQVSIFTKAYEGLKATLSTGVSIFKGVGSAIFSITASLGKAALAIFSFPFKLFSGLIDMAQSGGGGNSIREAYEEVREVFGDLASGPGKAVVDTFKQIRRETGGLAGTGLSFRKVFGYGIGGVAALMKGMSELAQGMGDNFFKLQKQFEQMGAKAVVFSKGLGLSNEEFGELASMAAAKGRKVEDYFTEMSTLAVKANKQFGIGVKDMAKGMKELSQDVDNFGHLGPKAFAPITVYARKLGLEIKNMAGIMDKFSGFEDTTEAASKMSQAFGINVDSMALMGAQNPAEKIDILRKAFYKSGKDLSKFNYQQRRYLASLTGLEGKSLDAAFALDKQGVSYEKIAEESDKSNKKQISQQKVLKELSKGIKRLIPSGGQKVSGFFDAFINGFERGIAYSSEFRGLLRNIRRGLHKMKLLGRDVGRSFVKNFPGAKKMLTALSDFFDPVRFEIFRRKALPIFTELFKTQNFEQFFEKMKALFSENFGDGGATMGVLGNAFDTFMNALTKIAGQAIAKIVEIFVRGFTLIGKLILGDFNKEIGEGTGAAGENLSGKADNLFGPTIEMFQKEGGPMSEFKNVGTRILDKIKEGLGLTGEGGMTQMFVGGITRGIKYLEKNFDNIAPQLGEATLALLKKAGEWVIDNPGYAAAILLVFNPFGLRSVVLKLTGALVTGFGSVLTSVFNSGGIMNFARSAFTSFATRAGPLLSSAMSGLGSFMQAGLSRAGGLLTRLGGGSMMGGVGRLGIYGAVAAIGYETFSRASEIINDPKLRQAGVTTGQAIGGAYIEALGIDGLVASLSGSAETATETLARVKREGEAFEDRLAASLTENAERFQTVNKRIMSNQMRKIAEAGRAGKSELQQKLMDNLLESDIAQRYTEIQKSDEYKKAVREATGDRVLAVITRYKRKARLEAQAQFDAASIKKEAEKALVAEESAEIKEARAKLQRLTAQADIAAAVEALGDVEGKMKAANEKIKNIDQTQLAGYFTKILDKMAVVFNAVSDGLKNPQFKLISSTDSLNVLRPISNAASFLELATESVSSMVKQTLTLNKTLHDNYKAINGIDMKKFKTSLTAAAKKLAELSGGVMAAGEAQGASPMELALKSLSRSLDAVNTEITSLNLDAGAKLAASIQSIYDALELAANGGEKPESLVKVTPIVKALANFTGGNIKVVSNLPDKFTINIGVKIDSKKLGKAIVATNLGDGTGPKADYIQTGDTKSA